MQRQIEDKIGDNITTSLDRQVTELTDDLMPYFGSNLRGLPAQNIKVVVDYIHAIMTETHVSRNYRRDIIDLLTKLAKFASSPGPADSQKNVNRGFTFKDLTRDDVVTFLNSFRKSETIDPMHKWIGTYNLYRCILSDSLSGYMLLM
jgi:hypothetical protein